MDDHKDQSLSLFLDITLRESILRSLRGPSAGVSVETMVYHRLAYKWPLLATTRGLVAL